MTVGSYRPDARRPGRPARPRCARDAILWVLRDNQRARAFYESLGWRLDGPTSTENYGDLALEALRYQLTVPVAET